MQDGKRRKSDGVTVGKIALLALTACGSLLTYIYISNQTEDRGYMKSIADNVAKIRGDVGKIEDNTIVINEHLKNTDAMIMINAKNISKNESKLGSLHSEARIYWRK